jgi:membrane glycosyltransferase
VIGIAWAALVYWLDPSYLPWLLPVVGALALSIPLSVFTSRATVGRRLRAAGYFAIPEETTPPMELRRVAQLCSTAPATLPGLVDAVAHPVLNALCCGTGVVRPRQPDSVRREREALVERALRHGVGTLSPHEGHALLGDPLALSKLHFAVWASPHAHESWRDATATLRANVIPMPPVERRMRAGRSPLLTPRVSPPPGTGPRPPASPLH